MNQPSNSYWENRAIVRDKRNIMLENKNLFKLNNAYDKATKQIEEDYKRIFNRFAKDGSLSQEQAKSILRQPPSFQEVQELRQKLQGITDEKLYRKLLTQINSRAYAARLTRLEVMKQSIDIEMKKLAQTEIKFNSSAFENIMLENYNRTMFDVQKGIGLGFNFTQMDPETIQNILGTPWSGDLFSNRVWQNTSVLSAKLQDTLLSGFIRGASTREIARELQDLSNLGKFAAQRLVRTESNYFANQATAQSYEEAEIDKYRYLATLDRRTSKACQQRDGRVYDLKDKKVGVNYPPLHPFCRSTTIPYFEGRDYSKIQRRAVDADGNSILISADMNYKMWYNKYVVNNTKSNYETILKGIISAKGTKIIRISEHTIERANLRNVSAQDVRDALISPLDMKPIRTDGIGRKSEKYIGQKATVSVNPDDGTVIQVNPTSSKKAKSLARRKGNV